MCTKIELNQRVELIKKAHKKILEKKEEQKKQQPDISEIRSINDVKKVYQIHKLISDELEKHEEYSKEDIKEFSDKIVKDLVLSEYETYKRNEIHEQKHKGNYHAKDVCDMINKWTWRPVREECKKMVFGNEFEGLCEHEKKHIIKNFLFKNNLGV